MKRPVLGLYALYRPRSPMAETVGHRGLLLRDSRAAYNHLRYKENQS